MILASHGIIASQIASFDADAVAFFTRVTTAGGSLSTTEKQAVNQLVLDLKANSLWTPMKAIYPMVGASAAACAQNLKSSSFTGTFTSGWTFASTGATGNGTSAYFDTNLNEDINLTLHNAHVSSYQRNNITSGCSIGINATTTTQVFPLTSGTSSLRVQTGGTLGFTNSDSRGLFIANRTTLAETRNFIRNVLFQQTAVSTAKNNFNFFINARNSSGTAANIAAYEIAFSSIGDGLTDTQASNFYTAVQAFQTTLSRQV
jgi:hypothetical protein